MENLNSIFFYNLEKAIKTYRQYAQSKLRENGFEITIDQWMVLKAIDDSDDITQIGLAEIVFKDKASVTRIIDMLLNAGYLIRNDHPESKRRSQLTITRKGKSLLADIRPQVLKNRRQALKEISENEMRITEKVLKKIAVNCRK
jgi:DNA-binding MarR family transcriptional regulator